LVYTVFQFKRKGTPRHILYCKRSMQEWVWCRDFFFLSFLGVCGNLRFKTRAVMLFPS
jgi:hypothetical protein